jgi:hypothetical protein
MEKCKQYANDLLQQVYGGQNCQPIPHPAGDLPFTGFEIMTFLIVSAVLVISGAILRMGTKRDEV